MSPQNNALVSIGEKTSKPRQEWTLDTICVYLCQKAFMWHRDLLFLIQSKCLYVLELTVGFESNLNNNALRKKEKYLNLINKISRNYRCVRFVNLSMSSLSVFSDECSTFLDMMNDTGIDKKQQRYIIRKMINIAIRATYYVFCCRNRSWDSPDSMQFWYFFVFVFAFCFSF